MYVQFVEMTARGLSLLSCVFVFPSLISFDFSLSAMGDAVLCYDYTTSFSIDDMMKNY